VSRSDTSAKKCLDLFSGLGGFSSAFNEANDWEVTTVDINPEFSPDIEADIVGLSWQDVGTDYDVVLAGPPCPGFSLMNVSKNWTEDKRPDSPSSRDSIETIFATFRLIEAISPDFYVIENPVGMAETYLNNFCDKVDLITQCRYGRDFQKRTYLGHNLNGFDVRRCSSGQDCHEAAPRGSNTGTQSTENDSQERAKLPFGLSKAILQTIEGESKQSTLKSIVGAP
jgi:hypothetical protein